jgi:glycine C-acetyltransferase
MYGRIQQHLQDKIAGMQEAGLFKKERVLAGPQQTHVRLSNGTSVLNLCANNYLGFANHPVIIQAARQALQEWGYGLASVRFICGTQSIHKQLEERLSHFLGTDDAILYGSCFDANCGLFETLLESQDVILSDESNHASTADGIRLCKATHFSYRNGDMDDLEAKLKNASSARYRLIATDGVFSTSGHTAQLKDICDLADAHDAMVMVDDSHGIGILGRNGRGTPELYGVEDRIDIMTGTLGKALGGASGGYISGRKEIIDLLRQRSRPYLFSNSIPPAIVAVTLKVLELVTEASTLRQRLHDNALFFRQKMSAAGFDLLPGDHPIVPVMFGDERLASRMAEMLLHSGVYVMPLSHPVVPPGMARIRTQISSAHERNDLEFAVSKFIEAKKALGTPA